MFTEALLQNNGRYLKRSILYGYFVLMLIHLVFVFSGFYFNDDVNYARYAADISYHGFSFHPVNDHFAFRWMPIYFTGIFYRLFGMSAFTSLLFSALCFAAGACLLHRVLKNKSTGAYLMGMSLFFLAHSVLFYMHRLLADGGVCLAVFWMYYSYRTFIQSGKPVLLGLSFAIGLIFGIMTKESIVISFPLFAYLFLGDVFKKRFLLFWKFAIFFSVLLISFYLLFFKITTGDFLFRYHLLMAKTSLGISECTFDHIPFIYTLKRIGYELWNAMMLNGDLLIYLPALAAGIYYKKLAFSFIDKKDVSAFLVLLLSANFMTISFTSYVPLCPDARHFIFLIPFAAVSGGSMIFAFFKEPAKFIFLPLIFLLVTSFMLIEHAGNLKFMYILCTGIFSIFFICDVLRKKISYKAGCLLFVLIFSANYFLEFVRPNYPYYFDHKKIIKRSFEGKNAEATVFTSDELSGEISEFFMQYKTGNIKFLPEDSIKKENTGTLYYLLVGDLNHKRWLWADSLYRVNTDSGVSLVQKEKNVYLYRVNNAFLQKLRKPY